MAFFDEIDKNRDAIADQALSGGGSAAKAFPDITQLTSLKFQSANGKIIEINPKLIAKRGLAYVDLMKDNQLTSFLEPFIRKPIIWAAYGCDTAFTDGVRIVFGLFFAKILFKNGDIYLAANDGKLQDQAAGDKNAYISLHNTAQARFFLWVIVHECYHQLYQHIRRGILKCGVNLDYTVADKNGEAHTISAKYVNRVLNLAMDMEINRDIECQMYSIYEGVVEELGGVWYKAPEWYNKDEDRLFKKDAWEKIFDYLVIHFDDIPDKWLQKDKVANEHPETQNSGGNKTSSYKDGWEDAIKKISDGKFDPKTIGI